MKNNKRIQAILAITVILTLAVGWAAFADDVANNADTSVDATYEVVSLVTGGLSRQIDLYTVNRNGDGKNGCNLTGSTTLVLSVTSTNPSAATVSPASITFTACEAVNTNAATSVTVTPIAVGSTNIEFTLVSNNSEGTFNLDTARFTVGVAPPPNTPPVVSVTGVTGGANYEYGSVPAAGCSVFDAEDGAKTVSPVIGAVTGPLSSYGLGSQEATCSYTDTGGLTTTASATYGIVDTTAPVIAPHGDESAEATSGLGAVVTYTSPTTSDVVFGAGTATCAPASGSQFALGNTTVTCNAVDTVGNAATPTSFVVHVVHTAGPVIAVHGNETAEATSALGAIVSYTSPATSDAVDGAGTATCAPASGGTFALGDTTVYCDATDAAGNPAVQTSFVVHVHDTTPPAVTVPANITTGPTGPSGAVVTYSGASAVDIVDGPITPTCAPASGSLFGFGTNTVTCSATDAAGNIGTAQFTINVSGFTFLGFFQPVDNLPIVNTVKGGSTVPVKWKLQGAGGVEITDVAAVSSIQANNVACSAFAGAEDAI